MLYISLDSGLFRQLPEITGVQMEYRTQVNRAVSVLFGGETLPITTEYFYKPETYAAEALAECETGEPVFFRASLGKGSVFLLTLPLERHLSETVGAFFADNVPPYHLLYRELAHAANIRRLCDSDHPYVRLTEHPIDEDHAYIFAINYSSRPQTAEITVDEGYCISKTVYGPQICEGRLHLGQNDGALFIIRKKTSQAK